jgi:hypothetical protein
MLTCPNIYYDVDDRNRGIANGGIGIIHQLIKKKSDYNGFGGRDRYPPKDAEIRRFCNQFVS